jgi:hypothetical protein
MIRHWIGVASRDHVRAGVAGGFCQLCHGRMSAIRRLSPGDWIAYYSPRTEMRGGEPVQAFTALGRIREGAPYTVEMAAGFVPARRDVDFLPGREAPVRPLIAQLAVMRDKRNWAAPFRFGLVAVSEPDFRVIARAMELEGALA